MADFEGPGAITQAAPSIAASGNVVNPGGTQPAGYISGVGNVIYEGGSVVAQAAPYVVASGYCLNTAGTGTVTQPAAVISGTGNTGVGVQAVITQAAGRISGIGVVRSVPSLTPEQLATRAASHRVTPGHAAATRPDQCRPGNSAVVQRHWPHHRQVHPWQRQQPPCLDQRSCCRRHCRPQRDRRGHPARQPHNPSKSDRSGRRRGAGVDHHPVGQPGIPELQPHRAMARQH